MTTAEVAVTLGIILTSLHIIEKFLQIEKLVKERKEEPEKPIPKVRNRHKRKKRKR